MSFSKADFKRLRFSPSTITVSEILALITIAEKDKDKLMCTCSSCLAKRYNMKIVDPDITTWG